MTDTAVSEKPPTPEQPTLTHRVYYVKTDEWEDRLMGRDTEYIPLGYAWPRKDGSGFEVALDSLPIGEFNGRLTIRVIKRKT